MPLFAVWDLGLLLLVSYGFALRLKLDSSGAWWSSRCRHNAAVYRGCYGGYIDGILWSFVLLLFACSRCGRAAKLYSVGSLLSLAMGTKYLGLISTLLILACAFLFRFLGDKEKASILLNIGDARGSRFRDCFSLVLRNWIAWDPQFIL